MMPTSRANEIQDLIGRLGSRSRARVDAAGARLSIIGARAVEELIEALEGDNNRIRARIMPLLALIQDPRGREPLIAMLLDRNARMREIAARCLARFPCSDAIAALERTFNREKSEAVRMTAVHSLVEQYAAGQERALRLPLALLIDPEERPSIRLASFSLIRSLPAAQRRSILARLAADEDDAIRKRAGELMSGEESNGPRIPDVLEDLAASDYPTWNEAVQRLGASGPAVVEPLIAEMQSRAHDPEYCTRAGMVLKTLGPRRCRRLADLLDRIEEPVPLQVLVDVIGALGEKSMVYRLKDVIDKAAALGEQGEETNGFYPMQRVRAKAHLELAKIGSRVAIRDLRKALSDDERRIELELLAAVNQVGKRDELPSLLKAYSREDRFMRERIAEVIRSIMKREKIRRNSKLFRSLGREQRGMLDSILPPARKRALPRRASPRPAP
jgi:HEAT repeat protein